MLTLGFLKRIYWIVKFLLNGFPLSHALGLGGGGGGGDEPPPAPTPEETSEQAIQAQIEATPKILETQREFGPQFTQLTLEQLQQFGPQFAQTALDLQREFGPQIGAALRAEQEAAAPELGAAREALTSFLQQEDLLTPEEERQTLQDIRQAQNVRGFGIASGVGAQDELRKLTDLRQQLKTRRLNIALSTAGRAPVTGGSQFQAAGQAFGPGQLIQNVQPGQIFGLASSTFATQANIFNQQQQRGGIGGQIGGAVLGGLLGSFTGGIGSGLAAGFFPS